MTLTALARELNTTQMTIYRKLKKNGVNIADLRDDATNELTSEGISVISALFDTTTPSNAIEDSNTNATPNNSDVLQAQLDGAMALIEQLTGERDELRRQLATVTAALQAEQADRQQERQLLTGGDANGQRRRGFFARLFAR